MRPEQIPYGVQDFKRVRLENFYYVDKSQFIEKLESRANFLFFVRPRRFGKSMLCEMLRCYYDVTEKENFEKLFGGLYAGAHPTAHANRYFVLALDFSRVGKCEGSTWTEKFTVYMDSCLDSLISDQEDILGNIADIMGRIVVPENLVARAWQGDRVVYLLLVNRTVEPVSAVVKLPFAVVGVQNALGNGVELQGHGALSVSLGPMGYGLVTLR